MELKNLLINPRPWEYPGLFIVLEGVDGCGKSTQVELLCKALREHPRQRETPHPVLTFEDPGSSKLGQALRTLLKTDDIDIGSEEMLLLFTAARRATAREVRVELAEGRTVICGRWALSTLVYQIDCPKELGFGLKQRIPRAVLEAVFENLYDALIELTPDVTLVLDVSGKLAVERCRARQGGGVADNFEQDSALIARRADCYRQRLLGAELGNLLVWGSSPAPQVATSLYNRLRTQCQKFSDRYGCNGA